MIKNIIKWVIFWLELFGISIKKSMVSFKRIHRYFYDYYQFRKQLKSNGSNFKITGLYPFLDDKLSESGINSGHYFKQDLFVAQKIYSRNPQKHVDIGSRIDGFVAHLASFREVEEFDIRPLNQNIKNIIFHQADLMNENFEYKDYCDSISSLHVLEHFGLGRYGDPINVDGHLIGLNNIHKMLRKGGIFYFSVPFGKQRIEFNAHRIFSLDYLLRYLENAYDILSFSYIGDNGFLHQNVVLSSQNIRSNFNCKFGCAIFELNKL